MKITFDISDERASQLDAVLATRNPPLTAEEFGAAEVGYAIDQAFAKIADAGMAALAAKIAKLKDSDIAEITAIVDAKPVDAGKVKTGDLSELSDVVKPK